MDATHADPLPPSSRPRQQLAVQQLLTVIAVAVAVVVHALGDALPLGGVTARELAREFEDAFSPAAYTLAIMPVIGCAAVVYAVYQALPASRGLSRVHALAPFIWTACLAGSAAVFSYHYRQLDLCLGFGLLELAALVGAYVRFHRDRAPVTPAESWAVQVPLSLTLGWTLIALLTTFTHWAETRELALASEQPATWALLMIALATASVAAVGWVKRDPVVLLAAVWAFVGIVVRQGLPSAISTGALGGLVILAAVLVYVLYANSWHLTATERSAHV